MVGEGSPIPASLYYKSDVRCSPGITQQGRTAVVNARDEVLGSSASSICSGAASCVNRRIYSPTVARYTPTLYIVRKAVWTTTTRGAVWGPGPSAATNASCTGFGTKTLFCKLVTKTTVPYTEHRCDLTHYRVDLNTTTDAFSLYRYPGASSPVSPFTDAEGRTSRLLWGTAPYVGPPQFYRGFGYRHISAKHGWGRADEAASRRAMARPPVATAGERRTYRGPTYARNGVRCQREVVVEYAPQPGVPEAPPRIVTSFGGWLP